METASVAGAFVSRRFCRRGFCYEFFLNTSLKFTAKCKRNMSIKAVRNLRQFCDDAMLRPHNALNTMGAEHRYRIDADSLQISCRIFFAFSRKFEICSDYLTQHNKFTFKISKQHLFYKIKERNFVSKKYIILNMKFSITKK